jgi:diacylglycerol kinase (ATP)
LPAALIFTPRGIRSNSLKPTSSSKSWIWRESAGWATRSRAAARSEQAFREEIIALLIAVPAAFFLATETWRRVMLIAVVVLLMIVELLNTAVEKLSDHVTPHHHDAIGRIKDMASAAVGLALLLCGLVWLVALAERIGLI